MCYILYKSTAQQWWGALFECWKNFQNWFFSLLWADLTSPVVNECQPDENTLIAPIIFFTRNIHRVKYGIKHKMREFSWGVLREENFMGQQMYVACCKSFSFPIIEIGRATYIRQSHWGNLYILKKPGYAHHLKRGSIYFTKTIIFQHCTDFNRSWSDLIRFWSSAELEDKYVATVTMLDIGVIVDNSQEPKPWHCYIRKHLTLHQQVLHFSWYAPFALAA